jgi:hypothetical protein
VAPRELPLPVVDRAALVRGAAQRRAVVTRLEQRAERLPRRVRAAGEALRRFGAAEAAGDTQATLTHAKDFAAAVAGARQEHGDERLLALRAMQGALFVRAVAHWAATGKAERDLIELGGTFPERARRHGWIDDRHRLLLDETAAECLFALRWSHLAGVLETHPFSPTLDEWRLYYRTLLVHPEVPRRSRADPLGSPAVLARYVEALAARDPDYPVLLAQGILRYRAGRYGEAVTLLSRHLAKHPTGPWRLRAQNYLLGAYQQLPAR